jgi:PelA/Pel-15E family pectate lyase
MGLPHTAYAGSMRRRQFLTALAAPAALPAQTPSRERILSTMDKAVRFFRSISTEGGYLWRYSTDLRSRFGETVATATQVWVQPPGTPAVGQAFLTAWRATRNGQYLQAAQGAASALVRGQLESGGWDYRIEFDPAERYRWNYRGSKSARLNVSTLDDDNSQSAIRLLMDVHTAQSDAKFKDAAEYGLRALLENQYSNGAWPQRFPAPKEGYFGYYTFNDNTISDTVRTLIEAWSHFKEERYLNAVRKAGEFIIAAQRPEPQPVWAQQYDLEMRPAWARKFEPPSGCSSESAGVIRILLSIWKATGDARFLKPIEPAIAWFRRSEVAPGRWARFYELGTNRPLYFTTKYELTYEASDLPTHYSFQGPMGVAAVIAEWEAVKGLSVEQARARAARPLEGTQSRALRAVETIDGEGRWVNNGWIESRAFIENMNALASQLSTG